MLACRTSPRAKMQAAGLFFLTAAILACHAHTAAQQGAASQASSRPAKAIITVGKATTFFTGPLRTDGTVDYVKALNLHYSGGITSENNAAIPLLQALGPAIYDRPRTDGNAPDAQFRETLALLKLDMPKKPRFFVGFDEFAKGAHEGGPSSKPANYPGDHVENAVSKPWTASAHPQVAKWLKQNEQALELIRQASLRKRFFLPILAGRNLPIMDSPCPSFHLLRQGAQALAARAMLRAGEGQPGKAVQDLLAVHRLARLASSDSRLICRLVAFRIEGIASKAIRALACSGKLKAGELRLLLTEFSSLPPLSDWRETLALHERAAMLDAIQKMARGLEKGAPQAPAVVPPGVIDWDPIFRKLNWMCDQELRMVGDDPKAAAKARAAIQNELAAIAKRQANYDPLGKELLKSWMDWWNPDQPEPQLAKAMSDVGNPVQVRQTLNQTVGDLIVSIRWPRLGKANQLQAAALAQHRLTLTTLALCLYKADSGDFPSQLQALTPKYLKSLPVDPFSGKPFAYRKLDKRFLLYSVGANMVDDKAGDKSDDIVVQGP